MQRGLFYHGCRQWDWRETRAAIVNDEKLGDVEDAAIDDGEKAADLEGAAITIGETPAAQRFAEARVAMFQVVGLQCSGARACM